MPEFLVDLRNILSELYPDEPSIRRVIADSGIALSRIALNSSATNNWHCVLEEARKIDQVDTLFRAIERDYGTNGKFRNAYDAYRRLSANDEALQIFDIFEAQPLKALQTISYIAQVFGQDKRKLEINSQLMLQILIKRTEEWIKKVEETPEREMAILIGCALKAIAAISVANDFKEGEKFIEAQASVFRNASNHPSRIIKSSLAKAIEFIQTKKIDYGSICG